MEALVTIKYIMLIGLVYNFALRGIGTLIGMNDWKYHNILLNVTIVIYGVLSVIEDTLMEWLA
jgi:hypothetical protein